MNQDSELRRMRTQVPPQKPIVITSITRHIIGTLDRINHYYFIKEKELMTLGVPKHDLILPKKDNP